MTPPKEPKEVLLNNEERFRDLVEQVSDWIWEVNGQGVYTRMQAQESRKYWAIPLKRSSEKPLLI